MPFSGIERDVKRAIDALASNHSIVNDGVCLLGGERCTRDRHDASEGHHRSNIMLLEPINIHRQLQVEGPIAATAVTGADAVQLPWDVCSRAVSSQAPEVQSTECGQLLPTSGTACEPEATAICQQPQQMVGSAGNPDCSRSHQNAVLAAEQIQHLFIADRQPLRQQHFWQEQKQRQQPVEDGQLNAPQISQSLAPSSQQATAAAAPEPSSCTPAGATATFAVVYAGTAIKDGTTKSSDTHGTAGCNSTNSRLSRRRSYFDGVGAQDTPSGLANGHRRESESPSFAANSTRKQHGGLGSCRQGNCYLSNDCSSDTAIRQQQRNSTGTCGDGQPMSSSSDSNKDNSGSGSDGHDNSNRSSGGGGSGSGSSGGAASGSSGASAGGCGSSSSAGGGGGDDGDDRRSRDRQRMPMCRPSEAVNFESVNTDGSSEPEVGGPTAAAAAVVAGVAPGVGCSASDPVVLPGPAALGAGPGNFGLLGSPASLLASPTGASAEAAFGSSQPHNPAADFSQQGSFSFPSALPHLNLSAINTGGAASISSLADALLSPLATAGLGLAAAGGGLAQQGTGQVGFDIRGVQHVGSLDPGFPGFAGLDTLAAAPTATGRRASDAGPSGAAAAAAAASWKLTQLQLQQQLLQQQTLQQQLLLQQQQQQFGLGGGAAGAASWPAVSPSMLALEQQLQQLNLVQHQQQQYPPLSPAGSGSIHSHSSMMSGQQHLATPLLSPTPSLGMPPLPPTQQQQQQQQHMHRPPLLPTSCSAPSTGRPPLLEPRTLSSQLHLLNPGLMGLIGSNDPGLGLNSGPLSMSSSDNLLSWLSNDEFSRGGGGMLSGSASETDAAALARAAAALSITATAAGQTALQEQLCKQHVPGTGARAASSSEDTKQAGVAEQSGTVSQPATRSSSTATGSKLAAMQESPSAAAAAAGAPSAPAAPVPGLASAGSSSSSSISRAGSSGSAAASSIAHSLSGDSLPDLEDLKARSASFAAALAEAEAIAAGVEASMEAARQQQQQRTEAPAEVDMTNRDVAASAETPDSLAPGAGAGSSTSPDAVTAAYDPAELTKGQPSRHLWLGNLHQRIPRSVLRGVFEKFGPVDDVVTFPGRMYAFVNFKEAGDAARAAEAVQDKAVPVISGHRHLVVKFRPSRRALGKVAEAMVPGLVDPASASASATSSNAGSSANLVAVAAAGGPPGLITSRSSSEGTLTAVGAAAALRPGGSSKAVETARGDVREQGTQEAGSSPVSEGEEAPDEGDLSSIDYLRAHLAQRLPPAPSPAAGSSGGADTMAQRDQTPLPQQPSCSLSDAAAAAAAVAAAAAAVASSSTDSNAATAAHVAAAAAALAAVDPGMPQGPAGGADVVGGDDADIPEGKPSRHLWLGNIPLKPNRAAMESLFSRFGPLESVRVFPGKTFAFVNFVHAAHAIAAKSLLDGAPSPHITGPKPLVIRFQKDTAGLPSAQAASKALEAAAARARKSVGRTSLTGGGLLAGGGGGVCVDDDLVAEPAVNLSNKLNPNNIHFDRELAARYKRMSKSEKEALWAQDRAMQQLENNPTAASLLSAAAAAAVAAAGQTPASGLFDPMLQQQDPTAASSLYSQLMAANPQLAAAAALQQAQGGTSTGLFQPPGLAGGVAAGGAWGQAAAYQQAAAAAAAALQAQTLGHAAAAGNLSGFLGSLGGGYGAAGAGGGLQQYLAAAGAFSNPLLDQTTQALLQQQMANCLSTQQDPTAVAAAAALHLHTGQDPATLAALGLDTTALQAQLAGMGPAAAGQAASCGVPASPVGAAAGGGAGLGFTSSSLLSSGQRGGHLPHSAAPGLSGRRLSYPGAAHQQQPRVGRLSGTWVQSGHPSELRGLPGRADHPHGDHAGEMRGFRSSSSTGGGLLGLPAAAAAGGGVTGLGPIGPSSINNVPGSDAAAAGAGGCAGLAASQQQEQLSRWGGLCPGPLGTPTTGSSSSNPGQWPQHYLCPLTQQLMSDPVVAADGYTYERSAISEWLRMRDVSPVTGACLGSGALQPNYTLRQAIAADVAQVQAAAGGY